MNTKAETEGKSGLGINNQRYLCNKISYQDKRVVQNSNNPKPVKKLSTKNKENWACDSEDVGTNFKFNAKVTTIVDTAIRHKSSNNSHNFPLKEGRVSRQESADNSKKTTVRQGELNIVTYLRDNKSQTNCINQNAKTRK